MNLLKLSLASALLTVGIAVTAPLSAAQIGGPVTGPRPPGGSWLDGWIATVCWDQTNPITGTTEARCAIIVQNTASQCNMVVMSYLTMYQANNVSVPNPCARTSR